MESVDKYKCMVLIKELQIQGVEEPSLTGDHVLDRIRKEQIQDEYHRLYMLDVRSIIGFDIRTNSDASEITQVIAYCAEGITIDIFPEELPELQDKWLKGTKQWY